MTRRTLAILLTPPAIFWGAACAATTGSPATYNITAGSGTPHDIVRQTSRIFDRHQYEIERADTAPSQLVIETRWRGRFPFDDEAAIGIVEAMTRLTIEARSRGRAAASPGQDVRTVQVRAENMVRLADSLNWIHGYITPMFREYVNDLAEELRSELNTGVRVF